MWAILSVDKSTAKLEAGWARQARTGVGAGTLQTKDEDKYKSEQKEPKCELERALWAGLVLLRVSQAPGEDERMSRSSQQEAGVDDGK